MEWQDGEIEGVVIQPLRKFHDPRGWLAEIFRSDELAGEYLPVMGYASVTRPGLTRGPHEHREQSDHFAFIGPGNLRVHLWDTRPSSPTRGRRFSLVAGQDDPLAVTIPAGVVHSYTNISDHDCLVLNFPNRLYKGKGRLEPVDEIRYEDDTSGRFETGDEA